MSRTVTVVCHVTLLCVLRVCGVVWFQTLWQFLADLLHLLGEKRAVGTAHRARFPLWSLSVCEMEHETHKSPEIWCQKKPNTRRKSKKKKKQRQKDKCVSASILIAGCTLFLSKSFFSRCCCCGTTDFFPTSFSFSLPSSSPFPLERVRVCERVSVHQRACVRHDTAAADHTLPRQRERRDAAPRAAAARPPAARARQLCAV